MPDGERRLAAIMYTDVVGYTALTQLNESNTLRLLEEHRNLIRPLFTSHGGREIKTIGDAFLVEFHSALDAVLCGVAVQQTMHDRKVARGDTLSLRVGIHVGDVIESGNDILGDAVNIASRIEPLAEPGGICITGQVYDQIRNKFELQLVSLGRKELKNVSETTEVFQVVLPWDRKADNGPRPEITKIAVLPFISMSPDPRDEYIADGLTEEVISSVSWIQGVNVVSRTSVMQYKNSKKSSREIAKELGAGTLVEGSIRKSGDKVRITVQLIDATKDQHEWVQSWDRHVQDIFEIESDISRRIASSLRLRFPESGNPRLEPTQAAAEPIPEARPEPEFRFCRFCGHRVDFKANFCRHCGRRLPSVQPDSVKGGGK